jgi:GNAT superfamily N-acetyltransferase
MLIREVGPEELEAILPLIGEYQRFYRQTPDAGRNRAFFARLFTTPGLGRQLVALEGGEPVGFATLYYLPSSLSGRLACVKNDLFVREDRRGRGVARELLAHCARHAAANGYGAVEWQTEKSNVTAQRLYDRLGATKTEWFYYSLGV